MACEFSMRWFLSIPIFGFGGADGQHKIEKSFLSGPDRAAAIRNVWQSWRGPPPRSWRAERLRKDNYPWILRNRAVSGRRQIVSSPGGWAGLCLEQPLL